MFERLDDTIAAISSPPGSGPRAIVRLSGPHAFDWADSLFAPDDGGRLIEAAGHLRLLGTVRLNDHSRVPAEAYTFRAPASYTRQDLVELHTVGSVPVMAILLEQLMQAGARVAEPGEFTARAFFTGALDLTAVEGVAATIHAQTDAQLRASTALLHGALSGRTREMREELTDLLALVEAQIDFSEEPIEFVSLSTASDLVQRITGELNDLLMHSDSVERLEALPRVVLAGLPNAGKSTLFNRLAGMDRAIQSAVAGTTRDVITAPLSLATGDIILCDTAGLCGFDRETASPAGVSLNDAIEAATRRALGTADLILIIVDAFDAPEQAMEFMSRQLDGRRYEMVLNKMDGADDYTPPASHRVLAEVSAASGEGVNELLARIDEILFTSAEKHGEQLISLTQRHRGALHDAREALTRASELIDIARVDQPVHTELLALEIRHAVHALSLLLGEVTTEDLLGRIFSRFCIGK
jgi:tRNA modification GTPase